MTSEGSPTVSRVLDADLCTGCGLCAAAAPEGVRIVDLGGFNRPEQFGPVGTDAERVIATACPGAAVAGWTRARGLHPYWGPYHLVETGAASDPQVRHGGSSGGVITALAIHALTSGLVDRVVQVAPSADDPAGNAIVLSTNPGQVLERAGSRYVSSSPMGAMDAVLAQGGAIAFIGKPCDVSALRRLALVDPRVDAHVKLMLSFFCAGVPSRRAVTKVLTAMGVNRDELASFRYRGNGWPGKATATTRDGQTATMSYEESWGGYLSKEIQFRCKICPDAVGGVADIACADAWYGGESGYPTFEELEGRSLMMTRTEVGKAVRAAALAAKAITSETLDVGEIDLMQPAQARRKRQLVSRLAGLRATFRPTPRMAGLELLAAARRASPAEQVKSFLGTVRRSLRQRTP